MKVIQSLNPATEEINGELPIATAQEVNEKVRKAREASRSWRTTSAEERSEHLLRAAEVVRKRKDEIAKVITKEMGKPTREATAEVEKCAWLMEHFGENGPAYLREEFVKTDAQKSYVAFKPLGVIGAIMPWNFPVWQAIRFFVPALIAGNVCVLKPSSVTPYCGIEVETIFKEAAFPDNVVQTVVGDGSTAEALVDSHVNAISFTGSVETGAKVGQRALSQLKKVVLELGGSDPFIVCSDVDVEKAAEAAARGRFQNCGQSCISSKRFFVVKDVAEEFTQKFVEKAGKLKVGDPMDPTTDVGPMVRENQRILLEEQLQDSISKGGKLLIGGKRIGTEGYFYAPTIVGDVSLEMRVMREETFGPLAPIRVVKDEEQAIQEANDSELGLSASVWCNDREKAERIADQLETGMVTINGIVKSDPRLPFGGVKKSGIGRELSRYGLLEMVNIKSFVVY